MANEPLAAQKKKRRRMRQKQKAQSTRQGLRRSDRIRAAVAQQENHQQQKQKRPREEDKVTPSRVPIEEPPLKRTKQTAWKTIREARVSFWSASGNWPTTQQEKEMDRFRELREAVAAKKRRSSSSSGSLRRKRSDASISGETSLSHTPSDQSPRDLKSVAYRHQRYEAQLRELGSFMDRYDGISEQSIKLCLKLLQSPQSPPQNTLFDDDLFNMTLRLIHGRNETRVIRDIGPLIVPSAEILAIRGSKQLDILRETTNAGWNNAIPFCGPRPQPDYSIGFKRDAFSKEQLRKLQPFIGNGVDERSYFAATHDMYFPFLTDEVKCGPKGELDIADRQNAHSQTVLLRGLFKLFRLVGLEKQLHNTINGFSFSHSDVDVRIWAHLIVIDGDGDDPKFYREPIAKFDIEKTAQADNRWVGWTVAMNILHLWAPEHFQMICSAIDMLPVEVSELSEFQFAADPDQLSRSGLSQTLELSDLADDDMGVQQQQTTPATTIQTKPSDSTKERAKRRAGEHIR